MQCARARHDKLTDHVETLGKNHSEHEVIFDMESDSSDEDEYNGEAEKDEWVGIPKWIKKYTSTLHILM